MIFKYLIEVSYEKIHYCMTMSYDFQVTIEAESEEAAKAKFTNTPLEQLGAINLAHFIRHLEV